MPLGLLETVWRIKNGYSALNVEEIDGKPSKKSKSKKHEKKDSSFYVKIEKDDAEIVSYYFIGV